MRLSKVALLTIFVTVWLTAFLFSISHKVFFLTIPEPTGTYFNAFKGNVDGVYIVMIGHHAIVSTPRIMSLSYGISGEQEFHPIEIVTAQPK